MSSRPSREHGRRVDGSAWGSQDPPIIKKELTTLIDNLIVILKATSHHSDHAAWLTTVERVQTELTEEERVVREQYTEPVSAIAKLKDDLSKAHRQAQREPLRVRIQQQQQQQSLLRKQLVEKGEDLYREDLQKIEEHFKKKLNITDLQKDVYPQDEIEAAIILMTMKE